MKSLNVGRFNVSFNNLDCLFGVCAAVGPNELLSGYSYYQFGNLDPFYWREDAAIYPRGVFSGCVNS